MSSDQEGDGQLASLSGSLRFHLSNNNTSRSSPKQRSMQVDEEAIGRLRMAAQANVPKHG